MSIVREKRKMRNQIGDIDFYYLEHGTVEGGPAHDDFELFLRTDEEWKKIWTEQGDKVMESWIREYPCTRPWAWWLLMRRNRDRELEVWAKRPGMQALRLNRRTKKVSQRPGLASLRSAILRAAKAKPLIRAILLFTNPKVFILKGVTCCHRKRKNILLHVLSYWNRRKSFNP